MNDNIDRDGDQLSNAAAESAQAGSDAELTDVESNSPANTGDAENDGASGGQSVRAELKGIMDELRRKENREPVWRTVLLAVLIILLAMIIPASAVALKSCVLGESSDQVFASDVVMDDDSISFDIDIANSADMYRTYSYRTENGVMFVTVYSLPLGGCGGGKAWPQHIEIPCEPASLIEVCFEFDDGTTRTIWRRQS